ncbi:MAG TPA: transcriptional repressor [Clostridia bacterium]|nr:transcriptional repressor [Clostridia bacterium]
MKNYSKQREAIIAYLDSVYTHPTAEEIVKGVREVIPNISLGTVYRNLNDLVANHKVLILHIDGDKDRYDGHTAAHAHLKCYKCGKVEDIFLKDDQLSVLKEIGGEDFSLDYNALCSGCKIEK